MSDTVNDESPLDFDLCEFLRRFDDPDIGERVRALESAGAHLKSKGRTWRKVSFAIANVVIDDDQMRRHRRVAGILLDRGRWSLRASEIQFLLSVDALRYLPGPLMQKMKRIWRDLEAADLLYGVEP